jgi:hypothetical protein
VLDWGSERWAVEIKLTSGPTPEMVDRLHRAADIVGASRRVLLCRIGRTIENERLLVVRPAVWLKRLFEV